MISISRNANYGSSINNNNEQEQQAKTKHAAICFEIDKVITESELIQAENCSCHYSDYCHTVFLPIHQKEHYDL